MGRQFWRPGNMLYPVPAVLVTSQDAAGRANIMTAAWTGNLSSDPVTVSVSIRPERYSHGLIRETGEFVLNLTTRKLAFATDYCGVRSGRDEDKFCALHLTKSPSGEVSVPSVAESPVSLECRVKDILPMGAHDVFIGEVLAVSVDEAYLDEAGRFDLAKAEPIAYCHGQYFCLGEPLGRFGYSVRKKKRGTDERL